MPNHPVAFFHHQQLAAAFMQCAATALRDEQIDQAEHTWLEMLLSPTTGTGRVDLLEANDASDPPELPGTLMFSDPGSAVRRVFVHSPTYGLEGFEDRGAADEALRQRLVRHDLTLEATRVQGDVFVAQMNSYLSQRARRLERVAEELARLPGLDTQASASITPATSAAAYHRALQQFWKTSTAGSKHVHQLASKAFAEGFYQDLAQARRADGSNPLLQLQQGWAPLHAPALHCEKIEVRLGTEWVELAGAFTLRLRKQSAMLLYWPPTGLQSLTGEGALQAYLNALAVPSNLPLKYIPKWHAATARAYRQQPIKSSVFVDRVDSIVTLQELNLAYALSVATDDLPAAQVAVDDAIDVCALIDRRLATLDPALRWGRNVDALERQPPSTDPLFKPLVQSIYRLMWLANERDAIYRASPGIGAVAQRCLRPALAVFDAGLQAQTTLLQRAAPQEPGTAGLDLTEILLRRVSGFSSEPIGAADTLGDAAGQPLPSLAPAALEQTLTHAAQGFVGHFAEQLKRSASMHRCLGNRWVSLPALLRTNLEQGIRLEMALHDHFETIPRPLLQRLKQIFEKPLASERQALGTQAVRVLGLQLNLSPDIPGMRLKSAFVIHQPASTDQALLFWSPLEGLTPCADLQQLSSTLINKLTTGPKRDLWQNLLPVAQVDVWQPWLALSVRSDLSISTWPIASDPLGEVHRTLLQEQNYNARSSLAFAISDHDRPGIFEPFIDSLRTDDGIAEYFEAQSFRFADLHTREVLPDWLNFAKPADFAAFSALLNESLEMLSPQNSFLAGIPALTDFARQRLYTRLDKDFPTENIDPDTLILDLKSFTAAPGPTGEVPSAIAAATFETEQSLTKAAIDHFSKNLGAVMVIRRTDGKELPAGLTPTYVREMIRQLDIGGQYLKILNQTLVLDNVEFDQRLERFGAMASSMLMLSSLQHVLQDDWSRTALAWVDAIIQMPDGLARQPVAGQHITFSRLQLRAAADIAPDTVSGIYVICPAADDQGPVILFTPYSPDNSLRLYPGRADLRLALQTDPGLQTQILARLQPDAKRTYDHGGFVEPHVRWNTESSFDIFPSTPGPPQLQITPLAGNALAIMFEDIIVHVKVIASTQAVTSAQAQWESFTQLMTLGVEQASAFLPGRLAVLANLWQAKSWVGAATDAARHSQWGKALSEFATALASLATSRSAGEAEGAVASAIPFQRPAAREVGQRLRSFEQRNINLSSLVKDLALPVYRSANKAYGAVEGRVYQLAQHAEHWHIFTGTTYPGPKIRLDADRHWVLDQPLGLYGGGIGSSKVDVLVSASAEVDVEVAINFTVKAKGMQQIRAADSIKARQITAAHTLALRYLRNTLINLDSGARAGAIPHTSDLIMQAAFNLPATPAPLARRLRNMVADIYVDMLSTSMSPKTSTRYITGSHKRSDATSDAFVYRTDPARRVFLADSFFSHFSKAYPTADEHITGFYPRTHFQAAALIHELSHLNNHTADIAYLDSGAPYVDLIKDTHTQAQAQLRNIQNLGLGLHTPREKLFKVSRNGALHDLDEDTGYGLSTILKVTNTRTLEQARDVFYSDPVKRSDVLLANADTVTLLITKLGRVPFTLTPG